MGSRPTAFVASSSQNLEVARVLQERLEQALQVTIWDQDVVRPSTYVLDELVRTLDDFDFGIYVFAPDDRVEIGGTRMTTVRDNVLFELGLFVGRHGRDRAFVVTPKEMAEVRTPSDLLGLTTLQYDSKREDRNLNAALGPVATKIERATGVKGIRPERIQLQATASRMEAARASVVALTPAELIILDTQIGASSFVVVNDDICRAASDIIVSSDDNHFTARGGVSKAILNMLGPDVRQQLDYFKGKRFRQGHLAVTTGGKWDRRAVIHAAVIDLDENRYPTDESIRVVTQRVLNCAVALGARSLALPVLGGGYATRHLNSRAAARAVYSEVVRFLATRNGTNGDLSRVALYVFDRADADGLADELAAAEPGRRCNEPDSPNNRSSPASRG